MTLEKVPQYLADQATADTGLRPAIFQMLAAHEIQVLFVQLYSQSKFGYPNGRSHCLLSSLRCHTNPTHTGGDKKIPVLHISVDAGEGNPLERWSATRRDITALLDDRNFSDLEVEIQDEKRFYQPSLFPIHPGHAAVALYKSVREELLGRLHDSIGSTWKLLSLFEVGRLANVKKPAVVLMVDPMAEHDWSILAASLEAIIEKKQKQGPKLRVEIMPGGWAELPPAPTDKPGKSFMNDLNSHPRHGTSIGVRGERGGGTLGGYLVMKSPTKTHKGFLTNSHVVAPASSSSPRAILEYDVFGLAYTASTGNAGRTYIQYFAQKDVDTTKTKGQELIKLVKTQIADIEGREKERHESGLLTSETRAAMELRKTRLNQHIQSTEQTLGLLNQMPLFLGRTIVASGRRLTADLKTLDYAFVETSDIGDNRLPAQTRFDDAKANPEDLGLAQVTLLPPRYCEFSKIKAGRWYFKVGRTTGLTGGICNGVEAWIQPAAQHTLFNAKGGVEKVRRFGRKLQVDKETGQLVYDQNGKPKESEDANDVYYASEWVIVNGSIDPVSFSEQKTFCDQGDAGSLIIDREGRVAGILWGNVEGFCGPKDQRTPYLGAGLVTDIDDVKASMKLALGWPRDANVNVLQFP